MKELIYDLATESNPLVRQGIYGLYVLLTSGQNNPDFPTVERTDGLNWDITDNQITIKYNDISDIRYLLGGVFGNAPTGVIAPPDYDFDPTKPAFLATLLAHNGITEIFFGGARGKKRFKSLKGNVPIPADILARDPDFFRKAANCKESDKDPKSVPFQALVEELDPDFFERETSKMSLFINGRPISRTINPRYVKPELDGISIFQPLVEVFQSEKAAYPLSGDWHPLGARWNNHAVEITFREAVAVYCCPLGYVYTAFGNTGPWNPIGVCLDLGSFSEFDLKRFVYTQRVGRSDNGAIYPLPWEM